MKSKGLTLEEAVKLFKHEKRRFRRAGEDSWCEIHEEKIIRFGSHPSQPFVRGIRLEDAVAKDWEMESIYRQLSADEIRGAMLEVIRENANRTVSPMELLNQALVELELV